MNPSPAELQSQALIGQPGSRWLLPTPALVVDLDRLEANIAKMAARARAAGLALRPHAKTHKSAYVAGLQRAAGAVGVCCAKIGEAEALMAAGVRGALITSPTATADMAARAVALATLDPDFLTVTDHAEGVRVLAQAAAQAGVTVRVLIDVDVGLGRTGVADTAAALALAAQIAAWPALELVGVLGYGGHWQHMKGLEARTAAVAAGMARLSETVTALRAAGHEIDLITGGGTGSFAADAALGVLNEVQPGSYVYMDNQYTDALGEDADGAFAASLFVQARVVSLNAKDWVTVDAGLKAFATDGPVPRPAPGRFEASRYFFFGDEHGGLTRPVSGPDVRPGERVELTAPHIDPTVDRYDQIHLVRGDVLEAVAPIEAARRGR